MILAPVENEDSLTIWNADCIKKLARGESVDFYSFAATILCKKAEETLSKHFLESTLNRVIFNCLSSHSFLKSLTVSSARIDFSSLKEEGNGIQQKELEKALFCLIQEIIRLLGKLTAGLVTASLIKELLKITPETMRKDTQSNRRETQP